MINGLHVDPSLDIPIYQQIVDAIRFAAKKGSLTPGQRLPTVQELSQSLSIARGTIKRAYDELERMGLVEKVQGRGTFLRCEEAPTGSRKERAMAAIDKLFRELDDMGLSMAEIQIFVGLRLRQLSEDEAQVRVAVIEQDRENLSYMSEQLRQLPGVDLYSYQLDSIRQYPYQIEEDFDLIVTTAAHAEFIAEVLPGNRPIARVAMQPSAHFVQALIRLKTGTRLGVLAYSRGFAELEHRTCRTFTEGAELASPAVFSEADMTAYLSATDAVVVPKGYSKYIDAETARALNAFTGPVIEGQYQMDDGSLLYLEAKVKKLLKEKHV